MGTSKARDTYLSKINLTSSTPQEYLQKLMDSPYLSHRRAAKGLAAQHGFTIEEREGMNAEATEESISGGDTNNDRATA